MTGPFCVLTACYLAGPIAPNTTKLNQNCCAQSARAECCTAGAPPECGAPPSPAACGGTRPAAPQPPRRARTAPPTRRQPRTAAPASGCGGCGSVGGEWEQGRIWKDMEGEGAGEVSLGGTALVGGWGVSLLCASRFGSRSAITHCLKSEPTYAAPVDPLVLTAPHTHTHHTHLRVYHDVAEVGRVAGWGQSGDLHQQCQQWPWWQWWPQEQPFEGGREWVGACPCNDCDRRATGVVSGGIRHTHRVCVGRADGA